MKKLYLTLLIIISILYFNLDTFGNKRDNLDISNIYIDINGKKYPGIKIFNILDKKIGQLMGANIESKIGYLNNLDKKIEVVLKSNTLGDDMRDRIIKLSQIIHYGKLQYEDSLYNAVKKVLLGYSESGKEIYGYYKGNPENGFFGIFANLHGSYEYGTYDTAHYLLDEFTKYSKAGWFIIPTLNPDGLEYYKQEGKNHTFYIEGRDNLNNIDLNRNFCTKNFELKTFNKYGSYFQTGRGGCNSEKEVKAVVNTLNSYKFNKIISLHSVGGNFFIPDNSIDDKKVIDLGNSIKGILKNYNFDISYSNNHEKEHKVFDYEIDEGGSNKFTGTMETYIYEKYNIPTIIIELQKHGEIEYDLKNINTLF